MQTKEMTTEFITAEYLVHGEKVENSPHEVEYHVFDRTADMSDTANALFSGSYNQAVNYILGCYDPIENASEIAEITRKTGVKPY